MSQTKRTTTTSSPPSSQQSGSKKGDDFFARISRQIGASQSSAENETTNKEEQQPKKAKNIRPKKGQGSKKVKQEQESDSDQCAQQLNLEHLDSPTTQNNSSGSSFASSSSSSSTARKPKTKTARDSSSQEPKKTATPKGIMAKNERNERNERRQQEKMLRTNPKISSSECEISGDLQTLLMKGRNSGKRRQYLKAMVEKLPLVTVEFHYGCSSGEPEEEDNIEEEEEEEDPFESMLSEEGKKPATKASKKHSQHTQTFKYRDVCTDTEDLALLIRHFCLADEKNTEISGKTESIIGQKLALDEIPTTTFIRILMAMGQFCESLELEHYECMHNILKPFYQNMDEEECMERVQLQLSKFVDQEKVLKGFAEACTAYVEWRTDVHHRRILAACSILENEFTIMRIIRKNREQQRVSSLMDLVEELSKHTKCAFRDETRNIKNFLKKRMDQCKLIPMNVENLGEFAEKQKIVRNDILVCRFLLAYAARSYYDRKPRPKKSSAASATANNETNEGEEGKKSDEERLDSESPAAEVATTSYRFTVRETFKVNHPDILHHAETIKAIEEQVDGGKSAVEAMGKKGESSKKIQKLISEDLKKRKREEEEEEDSDSEDSDKEYDSKKKKGKISASPYSTIRTELPSDNQEIMEKVLLMLSEMKGIDRNVGIHKSAVAPNRKEMLSKREIDHLLKKKNMGKKDCRLIALDFAVHSYVSMGKSGTTVESSDYFKLVNGIVSRLFGEDKEMSDPSRKFWTTYSCKLLLYKEKFTSRKYKLEFDENQKKVSTKMIEFISNAVKSRDEE